jgi:hypothetical protein
VRARHGQADRGLARVAVRARATGGALTGPRTPGAGHRRRQVERSGHAAPFVGDFYGDGKPALLVGQFDGGKLRVYRNVGTAKEPKFGAFEWFKASDALGTIPAG